MKIMLLLAASVAFAAPVQAQYYAEPPPPGYYGGPRYDGPRYHEREVRFGRHCEAFMRSEYGPQRLYCPIVQAKPLGEDCACPPPTPPGYAPGPFVGGRTVR